MARKAKRRQFTAEYKLRILREGLHPSHLTTWRQARERGELDGPAAKKLGQAGTRPHRLRRPLGLTQEGFMASCSAGDRHG